MNRAQKYLLGLAKGTHFEKIVDTEYGKENVYISPEGKKHSLAMIKDMISWRISTQEEFRFFDELFI